MPISHRTGPPIVFPAVQQPIADPNTLDDYAEGVWTPVLTFATPGDLSVAYAQQQGSFTKIGRLVSVQCHIDTSSFTHTTASGAIMITGLPFPSASSPGNISWTGAIQYSGIDKTGFSQLNAQMEANEAFIFVNAAMLVTTFAEDGIVAADVPTGGNVILRIGIQYHI